MIVALGVVVGFPLLTALALRHVSAAHSIVFIGLLPLATAIFAVLRGGERPRPAFWIFSVVGSLSVAGFALSRGGAGSLTGDLLMVAAIVACGLGYAEGAVLSRRLGGWQVICWALVLALPIMPLIALAEPARQLARRRRRRPGWAWPMSRCSACWSGSSSGIAAWPLAASPGSASCSCCKPFFGLALAGLLLHEPIAPAMLAVTAVIVLCVAGAKRFA
ncbi:EamA/RhaT family transporter [Caulobacter segnis]